MRTRTRQFLIGSMAAFSLGATVPAAALVLVTTDPAEVDTFAGELDLEDFEGIGGTGISDYGAGQTVAPGSLFNSFDGTQLPTFNSGGGTPSDPVGNPGHPIGIVAPQGAIAGDVESGANVAAPLVIDTDEPFNNGFMEVFFPEPVARVGFWITHGEVSLTLRDETGADLETGDVTVSGVAGEFIGIQREFTDVTVAAILLEPGFDAFTIDDFVSGSAGEVPEPAAALLLLVGGLVLTAGRALRSKA
ncbi:MAG: hypothetical protein OEP95_07070 [Myxococcales bacterium]|nr:hypothetical protein [Myxococcales bacterium]